MIYGADSALSTSRYHNLLKIPLKKREKVWVNEFFSTIKTDLFSSSIRVQWSVRTRQQQQRDVILRFLIISAAFQEGAHPSGRITTSSDGVEFQLNKYCKYKIGSYGHFSIRFYDHSLKSVRKWLLNSCEKPLLDFFPFYF